MNKSIKIFGVVSNLGNVELLYRRYTINSTEFTDVENKLGAVFNSYIVSTKGQKLSTKEMYKLGLRILSEFKSIGYYIRLR